MGRDLPRRDKIAPESQVMDLSHGVPPLDVRAGALLLSDSLPYLRQETIVLAVIDPSIGRDRDINAATGLSVGTDDLVCLSREHN
jgi:S-adenosyl-L-methionine hydrolase (adenosine-forming)